MEKKKKVLKQLKQIQCIVLVLFCLFFPKKTNPALSAAQSYADESL